MKDIYLNPVLMHELDHLFCQFSDLELVEQVRSMPATPAMDAGCDIKLLDKDKMLEFIRHLRQTRSIAQ